MDLVIGILLIISFVGMVIYCVKGYNLMVGFIIMATIWTILPMIGNFFHPVPAFQDYSNLDMLVKVYQSAPEKWGGVLVNIFFGAFFGRVLLDTGIAATIIRKSVELGGDNPAIILTVVNIITGIIFTSMSGAGSVIAIAVIILPILFSIGIPKSVALFSFTGSVAAGIFINPINFSQYQAFFANVLGGTTYQYTDYFQFGIIAFCVMLLVVSAASWLYLKLNKPTYSWEVKEETKVVDTPALSLLTPFLPVVGVIIFRLPVILCFILTSLYALGICGELVGGFKAVCRLLSRLFSSAVNDTASLVGFWLCLSTFNAAAEFAGPYFQTVIGGFIPNSAFLLCVVFVILCPLTWFRGPMSLIGCGAAILAVVSQVTGFSVTYLYPLFISIMIGMGHFDITTSWIAWGLGYARVEAKDYMKLALVPGILISLILEIITLVVYGGI